MTCQNLCQAGLKALESKQRCLDSQERARDMEMEQQRKSMLGRESELLRLVEEREAERKISQDKILMLQRREEELMQAAARWEREREAREAESRSLEGKIEQLKEEWMGEWRLAEAEASHRLASELDLAVRQVCLRPLPHLCSSVHAHVCAHVCTWRACVL